MQDRVRRAWLMGGAFAGCVLVAVQILSDVRVPVRFTSGTAARVNGRVIDAESVARTVAALVAESRGSSAALRERVISRMIDEELLIAHALDSGAPRTDPDVRAALVRSAVARVNAETASQPLTEKDIDAFYAAHRASYANPAAYAVTPLYYESASYPDMAAAEHRATAARAGLHAGGALRSVEYTADRLPFEAPAALMAAPTIANYFGSSAAAELDAAATGDTTAPVPFGRGVLMLYVNRRVGSETPPLTEVLDLVRADLLRQRQDEALEHVLDGLRRQARIDIAPAPPNGSSR